MIILIIIFRSQVDVDAALVEAERVGRACSRQFPSCSVSRIDILRQLYDLDAVFCSLLVGVVVVVIVIVVLILVFLWLRVKDRNSQAILGSCQHETDTFCAAGFTRIRRTPFATCPCHMDCRKLNQKNQNQIVGLSQQQQQNLVIVFSILHLFTNAPNKNTSYKSLDIIELCLRTEDWNVKRIAYDIDQ